MFPGANSEIYYNEDGEVLGWDSPAYDEDPYDEGRDYEERDDPNEDVWGDVAECIMRNLHGHDGNGTGVENEYQCTVCGTNFILE